MFIVIIIVIGLIFLVLLKKKNKAKLSKETNTLFVMGAPGMGKTFIGVELALERLKRNRKKVFKKNKRIKLINKFLPEEKRKELIPLPLLYSNFPIKFKDIVSVDIEKDHLLLKKSLVLNSVVVLDEFGTIASQFSYNDEEVRTNISEFVRFFRHYIGEKSLFVGIDQDVERISLEVRRSLGAIYECVSKFKLGKFYRFKICKYLNFRQVNNFIAPEQLFTKMGFFPLKSKYDPLAFSERYKLLKNNDNYININSKTLDTCKLDTNNSNIDLLIQYLVKKELRNLKKDNKNN